MKDPTSNGRTPCSFHLQLHLSKPPPGNQQGQTFQNVWNTRPPQCRMYVFYSFYETIHFPCKEKQKVFFILEGKGQGQHEQMHKREDAAPSESRKPFLSPFPDFKESTGPRFLGTFVVKNDCFIQNLFLSVHKHIKKIQPTLVFGLWEVQNFSYLLGAKSSLGF